MEAIAVLFSIDVDKESDVSYDIFRESDEGAWADPITRAEALMKSCRDDFPPSRIWTFTGNDRARELRSKTLLKAMGIEEEDETGHLTAADKAIGADGK